MSKNSLAYLTCPGTTFALRVTPGARVNKVEVAGETIKISVTAPASDGQANAAVLKLFARALGVAKKRLTVLQGQKGRDKVVRLD
jgi:uncharacterized protein (TIGR00251 family)